MPDLVLHSLSLRYSSWSMRPWLALSAAGASFSVETVELPDVGTALDSTGEELLVESSEKLARRRDQGSVTGLFPVLSVDGRPIHESLAICEWVAETYPEAGLWPRDAVTRAQARAVSCEMMSSFQHLRGTMSCHVFARVPRFERSAETDVDIRRVFEIWNTALDESGGPFLYGDFGIPDCMYFPVLTRFRTYGVELPPALETYAKAIEASPPIERWRRVAAVAPATPSYDQLIRDLGGDPEAAAASFV